MNRRKIAFFFLVLGRHYDNGEYRVSWYVKTVWAWSRKDAYCRYFRAVYSGCTFAEIEEWTPKYFKYLCCAETERVDYIYKKAYKRATTKAINTLKARLQSYGIARTRDTAYLIKQWKEGVT